MAKAVLDIRSLARGHTTSAIKTLASIMTKTDAPAAARVVAAKELLDRGWGKSEQSHSLEVGDIKVTIRQIVEHVSSPGTIIDVTPSVKELTED